MTELAAKQLPKHALALTTEQEILVLHVDDDEDFLIISKRHLEQQGSFQIENALSVKKALEKIEQDKYKWKNVIPVLQQVIETIKGI